MLASNTALVLSRSQEMLHLREASGLIVGLWDKCGVGGISLPPAGSGMSSLQPDEEIFKSYYAFPTFLLMYQAWILFGVFKIYF